MPKVPVYSFEGRQGNHASSLLNLGTEADRIRSSVVQTENTVPKQTGDLAKSLLENGTVLTKIATDMKNQRDTAYAKDLVNQYSEKASEVTTQYLSSQKKDALNKYNSTIESLQKIRDDLSSKAENDMVSMLFEQNSQSIYTDLSKRALIHSAREGSKYNVATQQAYTINMMELGKQHADTYNDPNGEFQKYMSATINSIHQLGELEGLDKNDHIIDGMIRKAKTDLYTTALDRLFSDGNYKEGLKLIKDLEKNNTVSHDTIQKFEASYNSEIFKTNIASLESEGIRQIFDTKDLLGANGIVETVNFEEVRKFVKDAKGFSDKEKKIVLKAMLSRTSQTNKEAYQINQEIFKEAQAIADKHRGSRESLKLPSYYTKRLTPRQLEAVISGYNEKSVASTYYMLYSSLDEWEIETLELFRDQLSEKDYKALKKKKIDFNNSYAKANYKVEKSMFEQTLRDFGYDNLLGGLKSTRAKKFWVQSRVMDALTQLKRITKKEITSDQVRKTIYDVLQYSAKPDLDKNPSSLAKSIVFFWRDRKNEQIIEKGGALDLNDFVVKYTGENIGQYKKGDHVSLGDLQLTAISRYHAILVNEGNIDPTLENIVARMIKDKQGVSSGK